MKHRLLSMSMLMLSTMWWGGCEQSASRIPATTLTGPSSEGEAAKTDKAIRILSGQLVYDRSSSRSPMIDLKGTRSFRLSSTFEGPIGPVNSCSPCVPGDRVLLDSMAIGLDVRGTVTLHGKTYDRIGGAQPEDPGIGLEFKGEAFIAPPFTDAPTVAISAPFTFSGTFSYFPDGPFMPSVNETLTGRGIATVQLSKLVSGPEVAFWQAADVVFDFTN
jgi:hypothetical protein